MKLANLSALPFCFRVNSSNPDKKTAPVSGLQAVDSSAILIGLFPEI